jgi:tyrosyl-tRNA synthetase
VHLKADVELGGTDQLFNLNVGRDIMPGYGVEAQVVMTVPLLEGLDGVEKMSKSLDNYVGITDAPGEMFGKVMSISDDLMWRYYLLLTDLSQADIAAIRTDVEAGRRHPKQAKVELATRLVTDFHGAAAADAAAAAFEARFSRGELVVDDLPQVALALEEEPVALSRLVVLAGLAASASDAARKAQQGGVRIDGDKVTDPRLKIDAGRLPLTLEVGRRAIRIVAAG